LSFGFHRAEILGAFISVILIWVLTGILVYEAIFRIQNPEDVDGKVMFIVASSGLAVNILMGVILHQSGHGHSHGLGGGGGHDHGHTHSHGVSDHGHAHGGGHDSGSSSHANLNVTAAFIHVLGDALQSVGVMIAAGLIWYDPSWRIADPITTFIFSILVLFTTARLIKQSVSVLMEGVPEGIDPDAVEAALGRLPGVVW
jgi:zinc transporter 2